MKFIKAMKYLNIEDRKRMIINALDYQCRVNKELFHIPIIDTDTFHLFEFSNTPEGSSYWYTIDRELDQIEKKNKKDENNRISRNNK